MAPQQIQAGTPIRAHVQAPTVPKSTNEDVRTSTENWHCDDMGVYYRDAHAQIQSGLHFMLRVTQTSSAGRMVGLEMAGDDGGDMFWTGDSDSSVRNISTDTTWGITSSIGDKSKIGFSNSIELEKTSGIYRESGYTYKDGKLASVKVWFGQCIRIQKP